MPAKRTTAKTILIATLTIMALACGGDDSPGSPDGGSAVDAGAIVVSTGFAVGTDYSTAGVASRLTLPDMDIEQGVIAGVASTDPVVRYFGGRIYIVNRYGADNVTVIDAETMTLVTQISTGAGTNPQDVAVVGSRLYVAALASPGLLVLDVDAPGDGVVATIDLAMVDPLDGLPNCNSLYLVGQTLYVTCGILDDNDPWLTPRGPGRLIAVDTETDNVLHSFYLSGSNPVGFIRAAPADGALAGDLLVTMIPNYGDLTQGCVERIATQGLPASKGCLIDNAELGGYASGIAFAGDTIWLAVTEGWDSEDYKALGKVCSYDAASGILGACVTTSEQRPFDVASCPTGELLVADAAGGLRVYSSAGEELTSELIDVGLPPVERGLICY